MYQSEIFHCQNNLFFDCKIGVC